MPRRITRSPPARPRTSSGFSYLRAPEVYARAAALPAIEVSGIDMHIGSQITELEPFAQAFRLMADLTRTLRAQGHDIRHLDLGGGLGRALSRHQ